jgi:hypothetical protein
MDNLADMKVLKSINFSMSDLETLNCLGGKLANKRGSNIPAGQGLNAYRSELVRAAVRFFDQHADEVLDDLAAHPA